MTTWPNWVDLIIITILLRTCYTGFGRGLWTEVLNLCGAISVTALTVNYARMVTDAFRSWLPFNPTVVDFLGFWAFFVLLLVAAHVLLKRLGEIIKWERFHWSIQSVGLMLGAVRGFWWAGFILIALSSSGFLYLRESVEQRSVLGPRLLPLAQSSLEQVTERFPGARYRSLPRVPPAKQAPIQTGKGS